MSKISVLSPHVADLIAAGEVVERPSSVVKELMENSIDAGASMLTVEIKNGGMRSIRVTDNGSGMSPDDAETAFLRHATSKLRDERGLEAIGTLGFRGEALAAISSVSRVELITCERGENFGTGIFLEGGKVLEKAETGASAGTTITVSDLFFNTPARLKFMKPDKAEGAAVTSAVVRCALSHPEVSVRYIKDGGEECHTPGDGNIDSCLYSVFGRDFARGMLKVEGESDGVKVFGYSSSPAFLRGNRTSQYFFVNGRFIKSKTLQAAVEQAYKNSKFVGRFPACVIYITLSPASVDVNVHPAKTEVKFLNEKAVFDAVYYGTLSALERESDKAEIKLSPSTKAVISQPVSDTSRITEKTASAPKSDFFKKMPAEDFKKYSGGGAFKSKSFSSAQSAAPSSPARDTFISSVPAYSSPKNTLKVSDSVRPVYQTRLDMPSSAPVPEAPVEKIVEKDEPAYRIIGEALKTYILVEKGDSVFLIDKHAAHERINFDRLKTEEHGIMKQLLLTPIILSLSAEDTAFILENSETLDAFGFEADDFGGGRIALHQVPSDIDAGDAGEILEALAENIRLKRISPADIRDELLHSIACKAAIKAGRSTDTGEVAQLVEKVMSGEVKYCPHGRPVSMELTRAAIDKNFKRS